MKITRELKIVRFVNFEKNTGKIIEKILRKFPEN